MGSADQQLTGAAKTPFLAGVLDHGKTGRVEVWGKTLETGLEPAKSTRNDAAPAFRQGLGTSDYNSEITHFEKPIREVAGPLCRVPRNVGSTLDKTGGTITVTYRGGTKFDTVATDSQGKRIWHGELFMREEAGVVGEGFYSYDNQDDTGIHRVIYNPVLNHFNVSGENTSSPEGARDFKMIWERKK